MDQPHRVQTKNKFINDFRSQTYVTPVDQYMKFYGSMDRTQRRIHLLEWAWVQDPAKWKYNASLVQRVYRGYRARKRVIKLRSQHRIQNASTQLAKKGALLLVQGPRDRIEGISTIRDALSLDSENLIALYFNGQILDSEGRFQEAIEHYTKVIENVKVPNAEFYHHRGRSYGRLKEYVPALADITTAIDMDSSNPHFFYFRATIYSQQQQYELGVRDLDTVEGLAHALPPRQRNQLLSMRFYMTRAFLHACIHNWESAISNLGWGMNVDLESAKATKLRPDTRYLESKISYEPYLLRAKVYCCVRKWDLAASDLHYTSHLCPSTDTRSRDLLAILNTPYDPLPINVHSESASFTPMTLEEDPDVVPAPTEDAPPSVPNEEG